MIDYMSAKNFTKHILYNKYNVFEKIHIYRVESQLMELSTFGSKIMRCVVFFMMVH